MLPKAARVACMAAYFAQPLPQGGLKQVQREVFDRLKKTDRFNITTNINHITARNIFISPAEVRNLIIQTMPK